MSSAADAIDTLPISGRSKPNSQPLHLFTWGLSPKLQNSPVSTNRAVQPCQRINLLGWALTSRPWWINAPNSSPFSGLLRDGLPSLPLVRDPAQCPAAAACQTAHPLLAPFPFVSPHFTPSPHPAPLPVFIFTSQINYLHCFWPLLG